MDGEFTEGPHTGYSNGEVKALMAPLVGFPAEQIVAVFTLTFVDFGPQMGVVFGGFEDVANAEEVLKFALAQVREHGQGHDST